MNIQRGARGDNNVLSVLHLKKLIYFLHFLFSPITELVLQMGSKRPVKEQVRMLPGAPCSQASAPMKADLFIRL